MPLVQELNRVDELVMTEPKRASHIFFLNVPTAFTQHGARLAQSVEHETLNLRVVGSSPTLGGAFFMADKRSCVLLAEVINFAFRIVNT